MTGTLSEKLIARLSACFPNRRLRLHPGKQPVASFPASHPEVGDLYIDDDGDELTISVGRLTHAHFSPTTYQAPSQKNDDEVIERVIAFLNEAFNDQIEFWAADRMGGWHPRGEKPLVQQPNMRRFVWSGPVIPPRPERLG
jgi:hypothetical protein